VADFLVHGYHHDVDRTIRRGVRLLAPGHALLLEHGRVRTWRWWSLPVDEPLRYRRVGEYVDHFLDVFGAAVRDRTPPSRASIFLSGGRDSPSVAALAKETRPGLDLHAFTAVYERAIREEEGPYAAMAAARLDVPVTWLAVDRYRAFERFESPELARPEPVNSTLMAIEADQWRQAAAHAPVLLTGFGGDAALRETRSRLARLILSGHLLRALGEAAAYARHHRRLPRPGIRTWLRLGHTRQTASAAVPPWIADDFARRVHLAERVAEQNEPKPIPHPTRPEAYEQLASPLWPHLFTYQDPGVTRVRLEQRHPFFDVRLVRFLLSVPPAQWYNDKGLLRIGMRGRLPEALLRRPKSPLPGDPMAVRLAAEGDAWLGGRTLGGEVEPYVDVDRVSRVAGGRAAAPPADLWADLRPMGLALWLRSRSDV
jgi:asparagine synthase (glutamine-hydrolysing)